MIVAGGITTLRQLGGIHTNNPGATQAQFDAQQASIEAKKAAPVLRIFEWLDIPAHDGHPHELKKEKLDEWIGQSGQVSNVSAGAYNDYFDSNLLAPNSQGKGAKCYHGWFKHEK